MKAEGDTTLRGATATADRIDVKTGGTLTIESLQDIAESMSRNSQMGGRVQVSFGTAWNAGCDPFTTGILFLNGRGQESAENALLNLLFNQGGQIAGAGANVGGLVMDVVNMNIYKKLYDDGKQSFADYQRAQEIGGWGVLKEKGAGAWSGISGYVGDGWDAASYQLGFNQKWNLADVAGNGFIKGDMGLDAALAVVSLGDIAALRAAATARKLATMEGKAIGSSGTAVKPVAPQGSKGGATDGRTDGTVGKLEPGNPDSSSAPRFGDRTLIDQEQLPTCGPTSCAMVLDTAGKRVDVGAIIAQSNVTQMGTTMPVLAQVLRNNGLGATRTMRVTIEELAEATAKGNPAIVRMPLDRGGHAVVVDGGTMRNGQYVVAIRDPAMGRQYFTPIDEFRRKFSGEVICTQK